ncbi:MAG: glutathione S-transferase N-terminal domain-containing protein [Nevskiales bacterium]
MSRNLEVATSLLASTLRGWRGTMASQRSSQPPKPIELYEFEACPYCRLVREALTELDLDAMIYPCPSGGTRFRPKVKEMGGKKLFPYMVDPNTATAMYESEDIINHLYQTYRGKAPRRLPRPLRVATSGLASVARGFRGRKARPSKAPAKPLELYSFESSPYSRLVRETLCELELPYLLRSFGKAVGPDLGPPWVRTRFFPKLAIKGRNRQRMYQRSARLQVPYLIDPNTDVGMYESADIVNYLNQTYGA